MINMLLLITVVMGVTKLMLNVMTTVMMLLTGDNDDDNAECDDDC